MSRIATLLIVRLGYCLALAVIPTAAFAQRDEKELTELKEQFTAQAQQFLLSRGASSDGEMTLVERPLLNWSNPERSTDAGAMFLWTLEGRPQAAMCAYPTDGRSFDLEFQSLSTLPLTAKVDGLASWQPLTAGIEMQELTNVPDPGANPALRLRQMRQLARRFSARLAKPDAQPKPLRLMSSPVFRYSEDSRDENILDGGLFVFVQGTDPEVMLLIEAVIEEGSAASWRFGLARMTMVPLQVEHNDELVWEQDWAPLRQRNGPYFVISKFQGR